MHVYYELIMSYALFQPNNKNHFDQYYMLDTTHYIPCGESELIIMSYACHAFPQPHEDICLLRGPL